MNWYFFSFLINYFIDITSINLDNYNKYKFEVANKNLCKATKKHP